MGVGLPPTTIQGPHQGTTEAPRAEESAEQLAQTKVSPSKLNTSWGAVSIYIVTGLLLFWLGTAGRRLESADSNSCARGFLKIFCGQNQNLMLFYPGSAVTLFKSRPTVDQVGQRCGWFSAGREPFSDCNEMVTNSLPAGFRVEPAARTVDAPLENGLRKIYVRRPDASSTL